MKNKLFYKRQKTKSENEKIFKLFEKLLPDFSPVMEQFFEKMLNFDPSRVQTLMAETEELFESLTFKARISEKLLKRVFRFAVKQPGIKKGIILSLRQQVKTLKEEVRKDKRYYLIFNLMREVDEKFPYFSIVVSKRHADFREWLIPLSNPMPFLQQAEELEGEQRASVVLEAFRRTIEHLYEPYVTTLWRLAYFREGVAFEKQPDIAKMSFGKMLEVASQKLSDCPQLVDADVGWMRNCITHEIPQYIVKEDAWIMRNNKSQPILVRVDDLLELTKDIYQASAVTIAQVGQLYLLREFYLKSGLLQVLLDYFPSIIFNEGESKQKDAERNIGEHLQKMFVPA